MKNIDLEQYKVKPNQAIQLKDLPTNIKSDEEKQKEIREQIDQNSEQLKELQQRLLAEKKRGLIFVLQAMDAAGKDEAERYLFSRLSSQALHTTSFDKPSDEDLRHDYLWRLHDAMPERRMIGVFNRSHYEDLVAARVYNSIEDEPLPDHIKNDPSIWEKRFKHVKSFEDYLADNGFYMIKIYLHVSKNIQKERLLERIEDPERNWEFSFSDLTDREHWEEHMAAFEDTFKNTSTESSPWYIVPADNGEYGRLIISEILLNKLQELNPEYPIPTDEEKKKLEQAATDLRAGKYD